MQVVLENDQLRVAINYFGAELASMVKKETGEEYIWNADAVSYTHLTLPTTPYV